MPSDDMLRTDLATEAREMVIEKQASDQTIKGLETNDDNMNGVRVNTILLDESAAKEIGKKPGTYMTIYAKGVMARNEEQQRVEEGVLVNCLWKLLADKDIDKSDKGLIVGLGNHSITPDALGPATINRIRVTNHLFSIDGWKDVDIKRPVAAISPGVMGVTGLETSDIVKSVVQSFQPAFLIVIDALASRSTERINETIQMTDTGIHPGSGVGNIRKEISEETIGIPVIAIGVPTVVDAVSIVSDTLSTMENYFAKEWKNQNRHKNKLIPRQLQHRHEELSKTDRLEKEQKEAFLGLLGSLSEAEKRSLLEDILSPSGKNMIVTPKEIDQLIEDMAILLANAINDVLQSNHLH